MFWVKFDKFVLVEWSFLVCVISDGKYHEQIKIAEDATGYSYEALFKPYISSLLKEVWVEDPYIRHIHQVKTFFFLFKRKRPTHNEGAL